MTTVEKKEISSPEEQVSQILGELKSEILDTNQKKKIDEIEALLQTEETERTDAVIQDSLLELNNIQREVNKAKIFNQIDEQIKFFKDIIETSKSKFTNSSEGRQTFRNLKNKAKNKIKTLETMQKQLNVVNGKTGAIEQLFITQQATLNQIQTDIDSGKFTKASADAVKGKKVNVTGPINNQKEANQEKYNALNMARYNKQLNAIVHDATVLQLFNNSSEELRNTMEALRLGTIDRTNPISLAQIEALYQLQQQGNLEQYPDIGPLVLNNQNIVNQMQNQEKNNIANGSTKEAFEKKGLMGLLDKGLDQTKMTPKQKEFWKGTSGLLGTAGAVFVGWKMISSAWKLATSSEARGDKSNRAWLLGPAALTLGANAFTGGNITDLWKGGKLTEYIGDLFEGKEDDNEDLDDNEQKFNDTYSKGFLGVGALFSGLSMDKIKKLVQKDPNGKVEISKEGYTQLEEAHKENNDEKSKAALAVLANRPKSDKLVNLGLEGIFGDFEALENVDDDKEFDELYAEKIARFTMISTFLEKKKYEISNFEKFEENIKSFISTGKPTLSDMEAEGAFLPEEFEINKNFDNRDSFSKKIELTPAGETFGIKIDKEKVFIKKINDDEIEIKTKGDNTTKVDMKKGTIVGLGYDGDDALDYAFKEDNGDINYYDLLSTALLTTQIKNRFNNEKFVNTPFEIENEDIYFNQATGGDDTNKIKLFDDGYKGYFDTYPESLEKQKVFIVNYLNKTVNVTEKSVTVIDIEAQKEAERIKLLKGNISKTLNKLTTLGLAFGTGLDYNKDDLKLTISGIDEDSISNDQFIENIKQLSGSQLSWKAILQKDPIESIQFSNINLDNPISVKYLEQILDLNDKVSFGTSFEAKRKMIEYYIKHFDKIEKGKIRKENIKVTLTDIESKYTEAMKTKYQVKLEEHKKEIEGIINKGIVDDNEKITFSGDDLSYDAANKTLVINGLDIDNIQNDNIIENLENVINQVSWANILGSEPVEKVELTNIDLGKDKRISVKYIKKLLELNEKKIILGGDFVKNKEMIEFVAGKHDEGDIYIKDNTNLNMNGIIILNYIYRKEYDFDRIFDGEDDSRIDFVTKAMEILEKKKVQLNPNIDPIHKWEIANKNNISYRTPRNTDPSGTNYNANNQAVLNAIQ